MTITSAHEFIETLRGDDMLHWGAFAAKCISSGIPVAREIGHYLRWLLAYGINHYGELPPKHYDSLNQLSTGARAGVQEMVGCIRMNGGDFNRELAFALIYYSLGPMHTHTSLHATSGCTQSPVWQQKVRGNAW